MQRPAAARLRAWSGTRVRPRAAAMIPQPLPDQEEEAAPRDRTKRLDLPLEGTPSTRLGSGLDKRIEVGMRLRARRSIAGAGGLTRRAWRCTLDRTGRRRCCRRCFGHCARATGEVRPAQMPPRATCYAARMPIHIESATKIEAVGQPPKLIEEFVGRVNTNESRLIARMRSQRAGASPASAPTSTKWSIARFLGAVRRARRRRDGGPPGPGGVRRGRGVGALRHPSRGGVPGGVPAGVLTDQRSSLRRL